MTDKAAIAGVYSDLKPVKTRGVLQIVIEVPMERADEVTRAFGWPQQGESQWLAVARMANEPAPEPEPQPQDKPQRRFEEMPRSQQAALKCQDDDFQEWIGARGRPEHRETDTIHHLRERLGVESRSQLDTNAEAAKRWDALLLRYQQDTGRMAEERR